LTQSQLHIGVLSLEQVILQVSFNPIPHDTISQELEPSATRSESFLQCDSKDPSCGEAMSWEATGWSASAATGTSADAGGQADDGTENEAKTNHSDTRECRQAMHHRPTSFVAKALIAESNVMIEKSRRVNELLPLRAERMFALLLDQPLHGTLLRRLLDRVGACLLS